MASFDLKNATVSIHDGTSNTLDIKVMEGNFSWTEKRDVTYVRNRGVLDTVRRGDEQPLELKFDIIWDYLTGVSGSTVPTPEDALRGSGEASAWTSTGTTCELYAVDVIMVYVGCAGSGNTETITFPDFRFEQLDQNAKDAQISCSGKCNVTQATKVRS